MKTETIKLSKEQLQKIRNTDFTKVPGVTLGSDYLTKEFGAPGSPSREEFENKAKAWYYGEILRDRRKAIGMTQKELAEKIGRERTYINRIEKGDTDMQLSSFLRIASALGITVNLSVNL
ncbi:MAG: helix-turn-helix transcriptional regulator [Bacteroidales bacterium]|nr:helix-turn-helix transcriptional regulator [Bacteroidales bacterium]